MRKAPLLFLAVLLTLATACSAGPDFEQPPDIRYGEDVCERCLMIINEARYASTYMTNDGQTRRFDDIGGMVNYDAEMAEEVAVYWVHDFETEKWLKAENAFFVEADDQYTPMGYGIVAFADRDRAERWASEHDGTIMNFSQLKRTESAMEAEHDHSQ